MVPMDPNGDAMVMCIDAIKKPMSFNDQKPTTFFFSCFFHPIFFFKRHIGQTSEVWQTEAMYLNLSVEGDAFWEAHERDHQSTHKTTKRHAFLEFFHRLSAQRWSFSEIFDRRSDVFFVPTFWREIPVDDMISGLSGLDNLDSWKPK